MTRPQLPLMALFGGPLIVFVIGASTSSVRDDVGATNIGIALAIVVVIAALVSRAAALTTAAAAALTFNFFHAEPYHSLRVRSGSDVAIMALLVGLGFVVADITAWIRRRDVIASRHIDAVAAPDDVEKMLSRPRNVTEAWPAVTAAMLDQLGLTTCQFERRESGGLPVISRVVIDGDDGFVLPSSGAAVAVISGGVRLGHLVLRPQPGITSLWIERRVAIALADHVALALAGHGSTGHALAGHLDNAQLKGSRS